MLAELMRFKKSISVGGSPGRVTAEGTTPGGGTLLSADAEAPPSENGRWVVGVAP